MEELLMYIELIEDKRQQTKVKHKLLDIVVIVLFAKLSNADDWEEIEDFAVYNENYLKKYIELKNGIPSHDTIQREERIMCMRLKKISQIFIII